MKIPKGVRSGQHIRLAKQGSAGAGGGESGDLFLEIAFRPHPMFHVEGKDVYLNLRVAPWEAELGASVKDVDADWRRRPDDPAAFENGTKAASQGARAARERSR